MTLTRNQTMAILYYSLYFIILAAALIACYLAAGIFFSSPPDIEHKWID